MVYYNLTNATSSSNMYNMFYNINALSEGLIFGLILISLFFVLMMSLQQFPFVKIFTVDSFVVSVVAFIMFTLGFIPWWFLILPIIMLMGGIIAMGFE